MNNNDDDNNKQLTVSLNYRTLVLMMTAVYILTISLMLFLWKPWDTISGDTRTITTTGKSTIEAPPDKFVFSLSYHFESTDEDTAIKEASDKTTEIVAGLKKLGVEDKDIKVNGYNQDWRWFYDDTEERVTVNIVAQVGDKNTAQKVQDYLLTTNPQGQITPVPGFSESKRKELDRQGRAEAVADAKSKAQASADELEVKLGKVISVHEGHGFINLHTPRSLGGGEISLDSPVVESRRSLPVQPGENELHFSVTVIYEIK